MYNIVLCCILLYCIQDLIGLLSFVVPVLLLTVALFFVDIIALLVLVLVFVAAAAAAAAAFVAVVDANNEGGIGDVARLALPLLLFASLVTAVHMYSVATLSNSRVTKA